jgi:hypothetical protein
MRVSVFYAIENRGPVLIAKNDRKSRPHVLSANVWSIKRPSRIFASLVLVVDSSIQDYEYPSF